jgi:hypothetical protein
VRAAALRGLSELLGDESLPAIFHAFCGDPSARVRYDAWLALTKVAKEDLPCDPAAWESFWTKLAGEVAEGEKNPWGTAFPKIEPKAGRAGNFFGIPLLGDRICFVLDTTDDMRTSWNIDFEAEARKPPGERMPDSERGKTRWTLVRAYVMQCLEALPEATELGFVFFDKKATPWPDDGQLLRNTAKARADAQSALERAPLGTSTAMYEGLAAGWGFVRGGDLANFEKGADTIVFVTDGVPTAGEMSGRSARLRDEVWLVATLRNVRFHTVGLHNHDYELLKAMARDSGGLYVHFQQAGDTADPQDLDFWPKKRKALEEARKAQRAGG